MDWLGGYSKMIFEVIAKALEVLTRIAVALEKIAVSQDVIAKKDK